MFVPNIKLSYERIDKSERVNFKKEESECMICHYWYFSDRFKYQPYVCNRCHDFSMTVQNLSDFFIVAVDYRVYIANADKNDAINIVNSFILSDKGVL